jgi:HK97 family phage prohead protease
MKHKLLNLDCTSVKFYEGKQGLFSGYASVFGGVDSYGDSIIAGAYANTINDRERPIQMRWNHFGDVIGKWTRIEEDAKGLYVEGELTPNHSKAMDVYASLLHNAISGLSIGYKPVKFTENDKGGLDLYEIDLVEISIVESPADVNAQIGRIKSAIDEALTIKDFESILRESGYSRSDATWFVEGLKRVFQGEPEAQKKVELSPDELKFAFQTILLRK